MKRVVPESAFTLIELLLAATISVLLAGLLISITGNALSLWGHARSEVLVAAQAQQALDLLTVDLQAAIARRDSPAWLACDIIDSAAALQEHGWTLSEAGKPSGSVSIRLHELDAGHGLADARFGLSGVWLRFLTTKIDTHADARRASSPAVVSYQIVRRMTSLGPRYELCRSVVRTGASASGSAGTFETGYDVTAHGYASPSPTAGDPGTVTSPATIDVLAADVVDFGVCLYARTATGRLVRVFPAGPDDRGYRSIEDAGAPAVVDVVMRTLTAEGVAQLSSLESQPAARAGHAAKWWSIVDAHSVVHVQRVELKRAP